MQTLSRFAGAGPRTSSAGLLAVTISAMLLAAPPALRAQQSKPDRAALYSLQSAFSSVAEELEPAVVTITARKIVRPRAANAAPNDDDEMFQNLPFGHPRVQRGFRSEGTGSGVVISSDGWILTNDHVAGGADKVTVKLHDGREFDGTVRSDYRSDLALVKIEASDLHAARLGDSDRMKIGYWAMAIGSPYRYEGSFSVGVISSLYRRQEIRSATGGARLYPSMIQTDAAINPGNSGGPLVNLDGEVIGINTAIESDTGGSVGIGFAIPINDAKFVVSQLRANGRVSYGYLGVEPDTVTPKLAAAYKVSGGARVQSDPAAGSPAQRAGIKADDVITEIDGKSIRSELDLRTTVAHIRPGSSVAITLVRGGVERRCNVTIEEWKDISGRTAQPAPTQKPNLGIEVSALSPEAARKAGLDESTPGVLVKALDSSGPAADAELATGDVILKVNNVETPTVEAFRKATASLKSGDLVRILWTRKIGADILRRVATITVD